MEEKDNLKEQTTVETPQIHLPTVEEMMDGSGTFHSPMVNDALKIMDGKFGGGFFVRYLFDEGSCTGWLQLVIQYPFGQQKTILLCKNVCKEACYEGDGLGEITETAPEMRSYKNTYKPELNSGVNKGTFDICRKYETPNMPIPLRILWRRIVENYEQIPVVPIYIKKTLEEIYCELIETGEAKAASNMYYFNNRLVFLTKEEIEKTIENSGYTFPEMVSEFAMRNLWEKDKNSRGYQKSVKIDKRRLRFYALRKKVEPVQRNAPKEVENAQYDENSVPISAIHEIETLKKEVSKAKYEADEAKEEAQKMRAIVLEKIPDLDNEDLIGTFF